MERPASMAGANFNEDDLAAFYQAFENLEKLCHEKKIPIVLIEGRMRDYLGMVDAMRLANPLMQFWNRAGVSSLVLPNRH